jgi:hypothetical protein
VTLKKSTGILTCGSGWTSLGQSFVLEVLGLHLRMIIPTTPALNKVSSSEKPRSNSLVMNNPEAEAVKPSFDTKDGSTCFKSRD